MLRCRRQSKIFCSIKHHSCTYNTISRSYTVSTDKLKSAASHKELPKQARAVIIGGGIIGSSVAYHLAKLHGWNENQVVLLERDRVTSGTTWHAAGLMVTFGSKSETSTELRKYSRDLYSQLEAETGQSSGFQPVGFIELACTKDRLEEFRRVSAFNRKCGVDVQEIGPQDVKNLFPLCRTDDILAGFYVKEDGRVNPVDATMGLIKGAKMYGAKIIEGVTVTGVTQNDQRVTGVDTNFGHIQTDIVVNCAGMWARQLAQKNKISVPNQAAEHYYLITDAIPEVQSSWPIIEDPQSYTYIRPEGDGLMIGLFETTAAAWNVGSIPQSFSFGEITPDWDRMGPFVEAAMNRVPRTLEIGTKNFFCGPESFTPDVNPIIGEAPELKNYFVAAGLNSIGILTGGGIGRLLAHWIATGRPDMDVTQINIDRFHRHQSNPDYRAHRVVESLGKVYTCHYPSETPKTARNVKRSAIYQRLLDHGAYFKEVSGWEGANWFAPEGKQAVIEKYSWGRENWFPYWQNEHRACRENVVLIDMSFMSKFLVQGRDAGSILNHLSTSEVNGKVNQITYTQWLNEDGKMEADLTVCKLEEDKFIVICTDTMHRHVETWLKRHIPRDAHAFVTDMTGAFTQINLQGPLSRQLLQAITSEDLSNDVFPFRTAKDIDIGYARALCVRITYVGELGYELFIPTEFALHVYERIVDAGKPLGLVHAGLRALGSLRMEKGYRDYGHDMDNTDTILEVGLGFTCDFDKVGGFIGKEAVLKQKAEKTLKKRLVQVLVKDSEPMMHHAEVLYRNGKCVGDIRAASYGHTLGGAVGLAMVEDKVAITNKYLSEGTWEVEIADKKYPAEVSLKPMYDPNNERIKC